MESKLKFIIRKIRAYRYIKIVQKYNYRYVVHKCKKLPLRLRAALSNIYPTPKEIIQNSNTAKVDAKIKISYINSLCVQHDAISESIKNEISWLNESNLYDVKLFCYSCDVSTLPFKKVNRETDITLDPHFQASSLIVFHFGIFYPLFDLISSVPRTAKYLVVFHNITPKEFVLPENYELTEKSFQQMANIRLSDHVICDSQTNLEVLRKAGINTPATVLPLAISNHLKIPETKPSMYSDPLSIQIAFIGRFVQSKGPMDLLNALEKLLQINQTIHLSLEMIGNTHFSNAEMITQMKNKIEYLHTTYKQRLKTRIHGNASEEQKQQILYQTDLFVLPTYHEGFCMPILEALASGCKIITYENSNTPAISGGFAKLIPTGNIIKLAEAIADTIIEITSSTWKTASNNGYANYIQKVQQYAEQYTPLQTKRRFIDAINKVCAIN